MTNNNNSSQDEILAIFSRFSHDIKNMLSTMYANYQLAEMKEPSLKDSAVWSRFVTSIRDLNSYVDRTSLIRYSYSTNKTTFDLCDLLYALPDMCDERFPDMNREINFCIDVPVCTVTADYYTVTYALMEIISNSYEATAEGDTIIIALSADADNATVTIGNSGTMPDTSENIFKPYVTTKEKHLGIGLTIAGNVAKAHNGTIKAESVSNSTVLHFTLPL
ncbi:MAG: sensor histidine kinase [Lachnospiraceae bacterium]